MVASDRVARRAFVLALLTILVSVGAFALPGTFGVGPTDPVVGGADSTVRSEQPAHVPAPDLSELHERGVTGDGVTVGVVGTGFDADSDAIAGNVDRLVAFDEQRSSRTRGGKFAGQSRGAHDTAVAEVVVATAPDAKLRLASVGPEPTPREYRAAVEWLVASDVDVIVDSGSYFPRDADSEVAFEDAMNRAVASDVLFVTSAGNYGNRHWSGTARSEGWIAFGDATEANRLGNGSIGGDVSVRLHWSDDVELGLYLYRYVSGGPDRVVASDATETGLAAIDASVPRGHYYVAVHAPEDPGVTDVQLYAPSHDLAHATAEGSTGPVASDYVVTVGATDVDGRLRADSSRDGLTLGAPGRAETTAGTLVGTSAAAPYVAGTVALMKSGGEISAVEERRILVETADRGGDVAHVDPVSAVAAASDGEIVDSEIGDGEVDDGEIDDGEDNGAVGTETTSGETRAGNETAAGDGARITDETGTE